MTSEKYPPPTSMLGDPLDQGSSGDSEDAKPLRVFPSPGAELDLFVGRCEDLSAISALIEQQPHRVLSIVGPAGVGKTQLAHAWLAQQAEFGETIFCSLAELESADDALDRVVAASGLTPLGSDNFERLERRLINASEPVVLVIDNAEHLREAVRDIVSFLSRVEGVALIVTSREPLGLPNEQVYRLSPLDTTTAAELLKRIAQRQGVTVPDDEAITLAKALDGLPLAIKLAGERTGILSPKQIQARLRQSNRVLENADGSRHSSLNLAFHGSWATLSDEERSLCIRLATFEHATTPDVLEALWPEEDNLGVGQSLMSRSWIQTIDDGPVRRWHMLRAVRAFVLDHVPEIEHVATEDRIVAWALANMEKDLVWWERRTEEGLVAVQSLERQGRLSEAAGVLLRLIQGGAFGFRTRTILQSAVRYATVLDLDKDNEVICRLKCAVARLSLIFSFGESAAEWSEQAVELADTPELRLTTVTLHAQALFDANRREEGSVAAREALRLLEALKPTADNRLFIFQRTIDLAMLFHAEGDLALGSELTRRAEKIMQDPVSQSLCVVYRALMHYDCGDFVRSGTETARAERLLEDGGASEERRADYLGVLPAYVAISRDDPRRAQEYLAWFHPIAKKMGSHRLLWFYDRAAADLAMAELREARHHLEHAYHSLALIDHRASATNEARILLALDDIYNGDFADAAAKLRGILEAGTTQLRGDAERCTQALRAALRFCTPRNEVENLPAATNAFERAVDSALRSLESGSTRLYDVDLESINDDDLTVQGFYFFRFEKHLRAWLSSEINRGDQSVMRIQKDGRVFSINGEVHQFSRKPALRRMLLFLAHFATDSPGSAANVHDLVQATWPNQNIGHDSAINRLHTTLHRLRMTAGIGRHLASRDDGYLFKQSLRIEWVDTLG